AFRSATPYISLPANREIVIGVAPGTSTSSADILANFPLTLRADEGYVVIANGVLDPTAFASNPDDLSTAFNLWVKAAAKAKSGDDATITFFGVHGSTDAPEVDIIARDVATLLDDVKYGAISGYIDVPAASYILDVTLPDDASVIVASYEADLSTLGGGSAVVFASGFLDPTANPAGSLPFGLYYTLADGTTSAFPAYEEKLSTGNIEMSIYPNPASETLYIQLNSAFTGSIQISGLNGEQILNTEVSATGPEAILLDITKFAKGLYIISVNDGVNTSSGKISIL
ncbi:MAG: T9SS type A sorting domain-containing protein, partial [Chitinophagales bacterium]